MQRVKKWLENPVYQEGVKLYEELGSSDTLKQILKLGESAYTRKKLDQEFKKILALNSPSGNDASQSTVSPSIIHDNTFILLKLRKEREQTYRQIDANMYALRQARADNSRREHAFQIIRLQRKKQEILDQIDHLEIHGALLPVVVKGDFLTSEIQRLYVQIWKTRKRLEIKDLRNREKTEKLLKQKQQLLIQLKTGGSNE